ncbi:hypothetical protein [Corynebacterium sp.]|uniref:hypothetical protein n=1 Tax=Corynebacterium sp. TaxID=1720 RepID=UPI0026DBBF9E|nr:hypothetical protein [Corynebacterium sp.]MDO5077197.1 hypothetical protein [Corynebacterium sp.]
MLLTITLTGKPSANGNPVSNIKALELAYLLSENDGKISKKTILCELYNNFCSKNALWYPVKGCSTLGVDIEYNAESRVYLTNAQISSDLGKVFTSLEQGDIWRALFFLRGPVLPGCQDWFADNTRTALKECLTQVVDSLDPEERQHVEANLEDRGVEL